VYRGGVQWAVGLWPTVSTLVSLTAPDGNMGPPGPPRYKRLHSPALGPEALKRLHIPVKGPQGPFDTRFQGQEAWPGLQGGL